LAILLAIRGSGGPVLLGSELAGWEGCHHDTDFSGAVAIGWAALPNANTPSAVLERIPRIPNAKTMQAGIKRKSGGQKEPSMPHSVLDAQKSSGIYQRAQAHPLDVVHFSAKL
jgi:hypothetical protein